MNHRIPSVALPVLLVAIVLSGCGRQAQTLNLEKDYEIENGSFQILGVDAPTSDQKVSVAVRTSGTPVDVYIVLNKDKAALQDKLDKEVDPSTASVLAKKLKITTDTVEAKVGAGSPYTVFVVNPTGTNKKATVALKLTGQPASP